MTQKRGVFSGKEKLLLLPFIPLLICMFILLFPRTKEISAVTKGIDVECFTDKDEGGNSKIVTCRVDSIDGLYLTYLLGDSAEEPFAGAGFFVADTTEFIDLSDYDYFTVTIDPDVSYNTDITLHFYIPGFSTLENGLSQRYMMTDLFVEPGKTDYDIDFNTLFTPSWWYQENKIKRSDLPEKAYTHFAGVSFSDHPLMERAKEYTVSVNKIVFRKHPDKMAGMFILAILGYSCLILLILLRKRRKAVFVPYEKVVLDDVMSDLDSLTSFLNNNYHKVEMCQQMVIRETGLKPHQIRSLISESYDKTFKQYITDLRMAEAKRLILETDSKIYKIAASIGYPHTSTFNHVFKETTGLSPVEYKKKYSKVCAK